MKMIMKHGAFSAALALAHSEPAMAQGRMGGLEFKEENNPPPANEVKQAVEKLMTGFEAFKATNDARLKEIEKKGFADPLTLETCKNLNTHLDSFERMSADLVATAKKAEAMDELKERFDRLETAFKRGGVGENEDKAGRVALWAKSAMLAESRGVQNLDDAQRKCLDDIKAEYKAINVSTDTSAGYLAPIEYVREIIKGITEVSPARSLVRVRNTANKAIQIPKRTGQFAARRIHEGGTKNETVGLTYGLEELVAPEVYALIDITNDMLEDAAFNMEAEISAEATEQFAVKEGAEFVSGTGVGEMEGILVNSEIAGINSGAATTITSDGIIRLKYALKTGYVAGATFLLNRNSLGVVRTLKDGQGNYIWQPGLAQGRPNSIDGDPYVEMPDMPNQGAGLSPIAYGDFRRGYTILDRIAMEMLRDPYTQATGGQIRYIMRKRCGGKTVLAEAIKKMVCAE